MKWPKPPNKKSVKNVAISVGADVFVDVGAGVDISVITVAVTRCKTDRLKY
jgi:hypothetical protein